MQEDAGQASRRIEDAGQLRPRSVKTQRAAPFDEPLPHIEPYQVESHSETLTTSCAGNKPRQRGKLDLSAT
ncbi:hypothetical protein SPHINGO8AM_130136 [Sphingomonas sp. 8AM]|nr:hypothetical protein SPHINGO8AM_130136 [Sphingomonas sp. 8AM]